MRGPIKLRIWSHRAKRWPWMPMTHRIQRRSSPTRTMASRTTRTSTRLKTRVRTAKVRRPFSVAWNCDRIHKQVLTQDWKGISSKSSAIPPPTWRSRWSHPRTKEVSKLSAGMLWWSSAPTEKAIARWTHASIPRSLKVKIRMILLYRMSIKQRTQRSRYMAL